MNESKIQKKEMVRGSYYLPRTIVRLILAQARREGRSWSQMHARILAAYFSASLLDAETSNQPGEKEMQ